MTNLLDFDLKAARDGLKGKRFSAVELAKAYMGAMEETEGKLNCYITRTPEIALEQAAAADKNLAAGQGRRLEGIPIGVKDLFCTKGVKTTAGSKILHNFVPPYESTVTTRLFDDGCVMLGKLNLDQFGMGTANIHSFTGDVINPWRDAEGKADYVPGGSSGGSSASVAARSALASLGTDTGGSTRQPPAFCGVVGIKPTYGRCSRWGVVAFASSLDCPAVITRTVGDCAIMLESMAGFDAKDSTSAKLEVPNYEAAVGQSIKGLRVGIPKEYLMDGMHPDVTRLWQEGQAWLRAAGAEMVEVSLPHTKYALPAYYIIAPAEASSNLARYDGVRYGLRVEGDNLIDMYEKTRGEGFGKEVRRRIMIGTYVLSAGYYEAYYGKAQKIRTLVSQDFRHAFDKVDVLFTPTTPSPAFKLGENMTDPVQMYLQDIFTVTANMAGIPAISVPAGLSAEGLPIGLQLMGRAFDEETLFRVGAVLEDAAAFKATPALMAKGKR